MENCDLNLGNAVPRRRSRAAFLRPRLQFFTKRTDQPAKTKYSLHLSEITSKRTRHRFPMKLGTLLLQDTEILRTLLGPLCLSVVFISFAKKEAIDF